MEHKKEFIINVAYYVLVIAIIYLVYKYLLNMFIPFIIGFILAYIALNITHKIKKDSKLIKTIVLIILYIIIGLIISLLAVFITNELIGFISSLPNIYTKTINPFLSDLQSSINTYNAKVPYSVSSIFTQGIQGMLDSFKDLVSNFSSGLISILTSVITYTPTLLLSIMVTIISSFFFLYDYDIVIHYIFSNMPEKAKNEIFDMKRFLVNNVFKVVRSYIVIMFVTFVELFFGFFIMKLDKFALLAFVICIVDLLPVLGVGTILLPWALIALIGGNVSMGISLAVLYLIITIIRNIIEPKLVGSNLGLHPLGTLVLMIVGLDMCGILGLFLFPLACSYLINRK